MWQASSPAQNPIPRAILLTILPLLGVLGLLWADSAPANADFAPGGAPVAVDSGIVAEIIDGDTVVLESGTTVRLTGIQAPKLALGRPGFRDWPMAGAARDLLARLSLGQTVALEYTGRRTDRWQRLLAHLRTDEFWLQHEMLRRGFARVYTFRDNAAHAPALYAAERDARENRRGIWRHPFYRIVDPETAADKIGSFQIVEGTTADAAIVRGRAYLNFGPDWRTDFTVAISRQDMKLFDRAGVSITGLAGKKLRVRGWIIRQNGAMIRVTHPQQLEIHQP